jgi:hypothetical protein
MTANTSTLDAKLGPQQPARRPGAYATWLGLLALLAIISLLLHAFFPDALADPTQAMFFSWPALAVVGSIGLAGAWLARRTAFPEPWAARISNRQRLIVPGVVGVAGGLLLVGLDLLTGFTKVLAGRHGVAQQYTGFLPMLLAFAGASILVQVIYRLLLLPGALWVISGLLLRGRAQQPVFWALAVLTSTFEPFTQWPDLAAVPGLVLAGRLAVMLGINFAEAAAWRKWGLVAMIAVRAGFYLVWHVLYVH